ncbi:uncharacterized protein METZ01_LOCUS106140 [marine metagenome]|uniref:Uncharacterized protein n=1 Tax=marine metagenome TaxID=408172 RepID=A0A381WLA9_9ZZZZ
MFILKTYREPRSPNYNKLSAGIDNITYLLG